jgi:hypothetical protein
MNKQIQELMNKARALYRDKDLPYEQGLAEYSEKFAELIVRECMELTKQCSTGKGIHDLFADEIIAEHFGVEL